MRISWTVPAALLLTITACSKEPKSADTTTVGSTSATTTTTATTADTSKKAALDEPTIVAIFDAANQADIETGGLAQKKGSTKEVRDFGAQLVRDHKGVQQQARDLAKRLNVTPTPPADSTMAKQHAAAMDSLRSKTGKDFDRAFLEHEVAFHQQVMDAVNSTLLPAIKTPDLKSLVEKTAPALQAHHDMAQNLLSRMKT